MKLRLFDYGFRSNFFLAGMAALVLIKGYPLVIVWAAIFWTASFALFVGVYTSILWGARADGRPG